MTKSKDEYDGYGDWLVRTSRGDGAPPINSKTVRQLQLKRTLVERLLGEAMFLGASTAFQDFDYRKLGERVTSPDEAIRVAERLLKRVASEYLEMVHSMLQLPGRYSFAKFLGRDADASFQQLFDETQVLVFPDDTPIDAGVMYRIILCTLIGAVCGCRDAIEDARQRSLAGLPIYMHLVSIGRSIRDIQGAAYKLHDSTLSAEMDASLERTIHGKKGAPQKDRKAPTEKVKARFQQLAASSVNPRNIVGVLAREFEVSRPTITARLKEK